MLHNRPIKAIYSFSKLAVIGSVLQHLLCAFAIGSVTVRAPGRLLGRPYLGGNVLLTLAGTDPLGRGKHYYHFSYR
jgi:hypothetical protein